MAQYEIKCTSKEMEKNKKIVGKSTGGAMFGRGMDKVNWKVVRLICNVGYSLMPKEKKVKFKKIRLGNITGIITIPGNQISENIILYIHGGGLVSGSAKGTKGYCSMLAKYSGMRIVSIDYRLAPENKYPAAIDDCEEAYLALRKMYPNSKICLTGESAGGYLDLALTVRMIEKKEPIPECIVAHSPVTSFMAMGDTSYYENKDITVSPDGLPYIADCYCPKCDLSNPELTIMNCKHLEKFPPLTLTLDANETLRAQIDTFYEMTRNKIPMMDYIRLVGAFHACSTLGIGSPETFKLMQMNIDFIRTAFGEKNDGSFIQSVKA